MGDTTSNQLYDAFGAYVRSQRQLAQLTLRQAAQLARISNPYLSQIEHGLALPSIAVLSALAKALSVSAESMLLQAAGIAPPDSAGGPDQTEESIRQDSRLDDSQKHALLAVLASFVGSSPAEPAVPAEPPLPAEDSALPSGHAATSESVVATGSNGENPSDLATGSALVNGPALPGKAAVPGEPERVTARRGSSTPTSARPAAAGRAASHRRKRV